MKFVSNEWKAEMQSMSLILKHVAQVFTLISLLIECYLWNNCISALRHKLEGRLKKDILSNFEIKFLRIKSFLQKNPLDMLKNDYLRSAFEIFRRISFSTTYLD